MALLSVIETSNHYWAISLTALPHLTLWHLIEHPTVWEVIQDMPTSLYEEMLRRRAKILHQQGCNSCFFFLRDVFVWMCLRVRDIFKCACVCVSHSTSLADIQGESGSLIDWCWFHLGSEQQLTVDLSRCERQPLILVLFKQHVLIYVIFTKSAREERLPFYVWLFIEVRGVPLYNPSMLPTRHLHRSGRVPEKWDPTPRINNCQGSHLRQSAQENLNV